MPQSRNSNFVALNVCVKKFTPHYHNLNAVTDTGEQDYMLQSRN